MLDSPEMGPMQSSSGFYRAPVSKALLGSTLLSSVALTYPFHMHRHMFVYSHSAILERHQIWRIFTSKLVYLDLKDMIVCSSLIYFFRIFERRFGSRKFASHLLATFILGLGLELFSSYALQCLGVKITPLPSGPLCAVYPLFVPYFFDIPRVALGHILGIPVTGKSMQYFLGLQLASGSVESLVIAGCGVVSGLLWRLNFLKIQNIIQVPQLVGNTFHTLFGWVLQSQPPQKDRLPMGATIEIQRQEQVEQLEQQLLWQSLQQQGQNNIPQHNFNIAENLVNGPGLFGNQVDMNGLRQRVNIGNENEADEEEHRPVSEDQVQQLVDMGFSDDRVREALLASNNDVSVATNILLQES